MLASRKLSLLVNQNVETNGRVSSDSESLLCRHVEGLLPVEEGVLFSKRRAREDVVGRSAVQIWALGAALSSAAAEEALPSSSATVNRVSAESETAPLPD